LLSEVALGKTIEYKEASYGAGDAVLAGKGNSTKGCGKTIPDPKQHQVLVNNVVVPVGKPVMTDMTGSQLLYNEYIVYDVDQVKMR
jgi:hypothetical protein